MGMLEQWVKSVLLTVGLSVLFLGGFLGGAFFGRQDLQSQWEHRVPLCQEDAVVIGQGDFSHGRWSGYRCGASVDDYQKGEGSVEPLGTRLQQTAGDGFEVIYDPVTRNYAVEAK